MLHTFSICHGLFSSSFFSKQQQRIESLEVKLNSMRQKAVEKVKSLIIKLKELEETKGSAFDAAPSTGYVSNDGDDISSHEEVAESLPSSPEALQDDETPISPKVTQKRSQSNKKVNRGKSNDECTKLRVGGNDVQYKEKSDVRKMQRLPAKQPTSSTITNPRRLETESDEGTLSRRAKSVSKYNVDDSDGDSSDSHDFRPMYGSRRKKRGNGSGEKRGRTNDELFEKRAQKKPRLTDDEDDNDGEYQDNGDPIESNEEQSEGVPTDEEEMPKPKSYQKEIQKTTKTAPSRPPALNLKSKAANRKTTKSSKKPTETTIEKSKSSQQPLVVSQPLVCLRSFFIFFLFFLIVISLQRKLARVNSKMSLDTESPVTPRVVIVSNPVSKVLFSLFFFFF
jgi:hypothetical protein